MFSLSPEKQTLSTVLCRSRLIVLAKKYLRGWVRDLLQGHLSSCIRVVKGNIIHIKMFGIEVIASPSLHFLIFFVVRIVEDFEKSFVTPRAPAVLWRARASPSRAYGVIHTFHPGISSQALLYASSHLQSRRCRLPTYLPWRNSQLFLVSSPEGFPDPMQSPRHPECLSSLFSF